MVVEISKFDKRIAVLFIYILCLGVYDKYVPGAITKVEQVKFTIFYFCVENLFVLVVIALFLECTEILFQKVLLLSVIPIFIFRILLEISGWGMEWDQYNQVTSNSVIDALTWGTLLMFIVLLLYAKLKQWT